MEEIGKRTLSYLAVYTLQHPTDKEDVLWQACWNGGMVNALGLAAAVSAKLTEGLNGAVAHPGPPDDGDDGDET